MKIRLLVAASDEECAALMQSLFDAALLLVPLDVEVAWVRTRGDLMRRVPLGADDVVFLDWELAHAGTPDLVRDVLEANTRMRLVALLPTHLRQYRQKLWEAGACSSIPKEHLDQEWMSSLLCLMHRAMCREARLLGEGPAAEGRPLVGAL